MSPYSFSLAPHPQAFVLVVDHSLGQWFVLEKKLKYYKLKDKQVYSREKNCNDLDLDGTFESGAECARDLLEMYHSSN